VKVVVYPADRHGCGHFRLIWPADVLRRQGVDVQVVEPGNRNVMMAVDDEQGVVDVQLPEGTDVVVFQRTTHRYLAQAVGVIRRKGVAVVVDVDDDLSAIHPSNPAWQMIHPRSAARQAGKTLDPLLEPHSWQHVQQACRDASMVTCTTPVLLRRYASHGRGRVIPNYLPSHYYGLNRVDSDLLGWPATIHSHPDDPSVTGHAIGRLLDEGATFRTFGKSDDVYRAFGLAADDRRVDVQPAASLSSWPRAVNALGIGIAPLSDTRFNAAKSWLKPLEMSAVGVPWVASPREDYRRLHELGCGVLVEKPKAWYRVLADLRRDATLRAELSEAGRQVAATLQLENHAWRYAEAWSDALELTRNDLALR
jgi:hypothetical protein